LLFPVRILIIFSLKMTFASSENNNNLGMEGFKRTFRNKILRQLTQALWTV
jgi:hypothetical protein